MNEHVHHSCRGCGYELATPCADGGGWQVEKPPPYVLEPPLPPEYKP